MDWLNPEALDLHFKNLGDILLGDAGNLVGKTVKYPHTDSFEDGCTIVPLEFEANQSGFVVFRKVGTDRLAVRSSSASGGSSGPALPENFPEFKPVIELAGPWDVEFDPKWFYGQRSEIGSPCAASAKQGDQRSAVRFYTLVDWTTCPEDAIKYYSGTARCKKVFDFRPLTSDLASSSISES